MKARPPKSASGTSEPSATTTYSPGSAAGAGASALRAAESTTRSLASSLVGAPCGPGTTTPRNRSRSRIGTYASSHAVIRVSAIGPSATSMPSRLSAVSSVRRSASLRYE